MLNQLQLSLSLVRMILMHGRKMVAMVAMPILAKIVETHINVIAAIMLLAMDYAPDFYWSY